MESELNLENDKGFLQKSGAAEAQRPVARLSEPGNALGGGGPVTGGWGNRGKGSLDSRLRSEPHGNGRLLKALNKRVDTMSAV